MQEHPGGIQKNANNSNNKNRGKRSEQATHHTQEGHRSNTRITRRIITQEPYPDNFKKNMAKRKEGTR